MVSGWEFGQLKVMRGKQRECLRLVVQVRGNAAGQSQTIKGGGAASYFIHEHQRQWRGTVQNLCGFGHLHHERGLGIGQVIGRTDARVYGIDGAKPATAGGHMAAHAGQQHNQGHLAHVSGLTAHVGAGDDLQTLFAVHQAIVGNETSARCFSQACFHHRMAPLPNFNARLFGKLGCAPIERGRALGECTKSIQLRHGLCQFGERLDVGLQLVQQKLVQVFFAGQCALLGRQGFVFKGFELGRDEALCIFQGLTAPVVLGYFVNLTLRHFNVKAMHLVKLNAQIGNARSCFFACFQCQ